MGKVISERIVAFWEFGLETRVVRYHNIYGPLGTLVEERTIIFVEK